MAGHVLVDELDRIFFSRIECARRANARVRAVAEVIVYELVII